MNSEQDNNLSDRDSRLLDALLEHVSQSDNKQNEVRIERLLQSIRSPELEDETDRSSHKAGGIWLRRLALPLAIAASILIFFSIQFGTQQNTAYATLERSIEAESKPITREYDVTVTRRNLLGRQKEFQHTLFVKQNMFAARSPGLLGRGDVWFGGQGNQRWLVPRSGAVRTGDQSLYRGDSQRVNPELPFLTITSTLEHIRKHYNIESRFHATEELGPCDHVIATLSARSRFRLRRRNINASPPDKIEFFASTKDGTVKKMDLRWSLSKENEPQRLATTLTLVESHDYPDSFFQHDAHHDSDRQVIEKTESNGEAGKN